MGQWEDRTKKNSNPKQNTLEPCSLWGSFRSMRNGIQPISWSFDWMDGIIWVCTLRFFTETMVMQNMQVFVLLSWTTGLFLFFFLLKDNNNIKHTVPVTSMQQELFYVSIKYFFKTFLSSPFYKKNWRHRAVSGLRSDRARNQTRESTLSFHDFMDDMK